MANAALKTLHGDHFTLSTQLIKPSYLVITPLADQNKKEANAKGRQ